MREPRYGYVIAVVTALFLLGAFLRQMQPLIPASQPNSMVFESGDFMRQAAYQQVKWRPMDRSAFAEARRLDRPVLVVIGTPWSQVARELDRTVFIDGDIHAFLRRNFVTVRVDGAQSPEWVNAFLPFSRIEIGFLPDTQIWALDPSGRTFSQIFLRGVGGTIDPSWFLGRLVAIREQFRQTRQEPGFNLIPGAKQAEDLALLSAPTAVASPDLEASTASVLQSVDKLHGGFVSASKQRLLLPHALRYLLMRGRQEDFQMALDRVLFTPTVDWIDGGFFLRCTDDAWMWPNYDKVAVMNADMMHSLAMADAANPNPLYRFVARDTFDFLTKGLMEGGFVAACRRGDETLTGRSRRCSFPPKLLREEPVDPELFKNAGIEPFDVPNWCRDNLGLRVETNPSMVPRLRDIKVLVDDRKRFEVARKWLHDIADDAWDTSLGGQALAEVNFTVAARCIWLSRLWNDPDRMSQATGLFDGLSGFVSENDVARGQYLAHPGRAYLGDYLSYADACLQDFLATGRVVSLENGVQVLKRAKELFQADRPGQWNLTTSMAGDPPDTASPEILDNVGESCTARVMRLGNAYGRLLRGGGPSSAFASELSQDAYSAMALFAAMAPKFGAQAGGYLSAASILADDRHAVVVGPDCVTLAAKLFRRVPHRLVAPCLGPVRTDLRNKAPGIYVVAGANTSGPFSLDQATALLKPDL